MIDHINVKNAQKRKRNVQSKENFLKNKNFKRMLVICFRFKNKYYMKEHELSHTGDNKQFPCDLCDKKLSSKNVLRRHMETHTGVYRRTYPCDLCDRIFRQSYELKCHRRTHTGEKPYHCDTCSMSMTTESQLKRHCKTQTHLKAVSELMDVQEQDAHDNQY